MNIVELKTLITIVETGSLVRASERLNVTQSTVTARLKTLEDIVGQTLIHRNRSGATLTAAGGKLLRYAETITDLWQQASQELSLPDGMSGLCNFACCHDLWSGLGDRFFETLIRTTADLAVSVWLGSEAEVARWLDQGKSDLAMTHRPAVSEIQGQMILPPDKLCLVSTAPDTPSRFDPGYVYVEAGDTFGKLHAAEYADAGTARISFGNADIALTHITSNGGSAYLPERMVGQLVRDGVLYRVADAANFERPIYLSFNQHARRTWDWFDVVVQSMFDETKTAAP